MDTLKQEKNRGYVIAGGAAIIAFIAYFLPYISYAGIFTGSGSVNGATAGSWLWLEFLGALVAIATSALFLFKNNLLTGTVKMPLDQQIKVGKYVLLGSSIVTVLVHLLFLFGYSASGYNGYDGYATISLGFGAWLFLLAAIGMIVGSVLALRASAPTLAQPTGQQYPAQPTQYPPYQQPYPPTDQQPYQQPQQPYQQPQQPYPPYQQPQQPYQQPQQYPPMEMQPPPQQQ